MNGERSTHVRTSVARRRTLRACVLGGLVVLTVTGPARAADAVVSVNDAAEDVTVDPSGIQYQAPDITSGSLTYLTRVETDVNDDLIQGVLRVDASPDPDTQTRLYAGRALSWRIDVDGNTATGQTSSPGKGADVIVVVFGSNSGQPTVAYVRRWQTNAYDVGKPIALNIQEGIGFWWSVPAADIGVVRGRPARVWFQSIYNDPSIRDNAPDDGAGLPFTPPFPTPIGDVGEATAITPVQATLTGSVTGRGEAAEWFVEYSPAGGATVASASGQAPPVASAPFSVNLTGLSPGTPYVYTLVVRNRWGENRTPLRSFVTPGVPQPLGQTSGGTPGSGTTAGGATTSPTTLTLSGGFVPGGVANQWWFEWGPTPALGKVTPTQSAPVSSQLSTVSVQVPGLEPGSVYYYRLVAVIDGIRSESAVLSARTAPVGRLAISGKVRMACGKRLCNIARGSGLVVRVRDAQGRIMRGSSATRGLRVTARCVAVCRLRRTIRPRTVRRGDPRLDLGAALGKIALRPGSIVEVRVTRANSTGVLYRATVGGRRVKGVTCTVKFRGDLACPPRRAKR